MLPWYDLILILILLGALALGFAMGLVRQLINVLGLFFGLVFASYYHPTITRFVRERFGEADSLGREAFIFFLAFAVVWAFINIGAFFSFRQAPRFLPDTLDRILGMGLGVITGTVACVIITLLLGFATSVKWPQNDGLRLLIAGGIEGSTLLTTITSLIPLLGNMIEPFLPNGLPSFFRSTF